MVFLDLGEQLLIEAVLQQCPLGVLLFSVSDGVLQWRNEIAAGLLEHHARVGYRFELGPASDQFVEQLKHNKPFYHYVEEGGFVFIPQSMMSAGGEEGICFVWMIPSTSMDLDLMNLQKDWIQQRKLANVGRMIVEMVHELSNPLSGISMGIQLVAMSMKQLKQRLPKEEVSQPHIHQWFDKINAEIEKISQAVLKASNLRQELLAYSKPSTLRFKPAKVEALIDSAFQNFESQPLFRAISIHKTFEAGLPSILCDSGKLEQIFYNLTKNASEAMDGRGNIWVRAFCQANMVYIEVEDNGPGIEEAIVDKIFSPFATHKKTYGSGLGLSISRDIIIQHGGSFSVYNTQRGACFQIRLPIFSGPTAMTEDINKESASLTMILTNHDSTKITEKGNAQPPDLDSEPASQP